MFANFGILSSLRTNKIGKLWTERSCQSKLFIDCGKMFMNFYECLRLLVMVLESEILMKETSSLTWLLDFHTCDNENPGIHPKLI